MSECRQLIEEVEKNGGRLWVDEDTLRGEHIPARLLDRLRVHKPAIIAELQKVNVVNVVNIQSGLSGQKKKHSTLAANFNDPYAQAEREAIQWESTLESEPPLPDVPGFEDLKPISLDAYRQRLMRDLHGYRHHKQEASTILP